MPRFIPAKYAITDVFQGDFFEQIFILPDAFPIESWRFECQVRLAGTTQPVLSFSSSDGSISKSEASIILSASAIQMRKVQPGKYRYDIKFFTSFDDVQTLIEGAFIVKSSVTILS